MTAITVEIEQVDSGQVKIHYQSRGVTENDAEIEWGRKVIAKLEELRQKEVDACNTWVSVADRLPPDETPVLVCEGFDGEVYISTLARYKVNPSLWEKHWEVIPNCGGNECDPVDCTPTHWMPILPVPRKAQ